MAAHSETLRGAEACGACRPGSAMRGHWVYHGRTAATSGPGWRSPHHRRLPLGEGTQRSTIRNDWMHPYARRDWRAGGKSTKVEEGDQRGEGERLLPPVPRRQASRPWGASLPAGTHLSNGGRRWPSNRLSLIGHRHPLLQHQHSAMVHTLRREIRPSRCSTGAHPRAAPSDGPHRLPGRHGARLAPGSSRWPVARRFFWRRAGRCSGAGRRRARQPARWPVR